MTTLYKLTDLDGWTRRGVSGATKWREGFTRTADGSGDLCGSGFVHAYTDPLLAVFLNPVHAGIRRVQMWLCEGTVARTDHGLKVGCTSLTTLYKLEAPVVSMKQRVRFGILCARVIYTEPDFAAWSDAWLNGTNNAGITAELARDLAAKSSRAWAAATSQMLIWAPEGDLMAKAEAVRTASLAAYAARLPMRDAASPARAVAAAANAAAMAKIPFNLIGLARQAMGEEA